MRRRKREERLQEVCQDGRRRFAAKRSVSMWRSVGCGQLTTARIDVRDQVGRPDSCSHWSPSPQTVVGAFKWWRMRVRQGGPSSEESVGALSLVAAVLGPGLPQSQLEAPV